MPASAADRGDMQSMLRLKGAKLFLLGADPADALDLERRPAAFFGDLAVLLVDIGARRFVAVEPAKKLGRHAAVGALAVVLIDDVEEGEFALGIGSGFLRHARLFVDARATVKRNSSRAALAPSTPRGRSSPHWPDRDPRARGYGCSLSAISPKSAVTMPVWWFGSSLHFCRGCFKRTSEPNNTGI